MSAWANSRRSSIRASIVPATVEFVDIAGLVKGASEGEGLGNQFLANIRETDAICEVVRFFSDPDVEHVSTRAATTRIADVETITHRARAWPTSPTARARRCRALEKDAKRDKVARAQVRDRQDAWATGLNEGHRVLAAWG